MHGTVIGLFVTLYELGLSVRSHKAQIYNTTKAWSEVNAAVASAVAKFSVDD